MSLKWSERALCVLVALCFALLSESAIAVSSGSGFFVTDDGFVVTNQHVVEEGVSFSVRDIYGKVFSARVVRTDQANDLALLKVEGGRFVGLPVSSSSAVKKGEKVFTIGFPQILVQGLEAKVTDGVISSFTGFMGEPNSFQISAPIQPGNSGGPLFNSAGSVIGVVVAKLRAANALQGGVIPENVSYAIKSNYLLEFLQTEPQVARNLKPNRLSTKGREISIERLEPSVVLVLATRGASSHGEDDSRSPPVGKPNDGLGSMPFVFHGIHLRSEFRGFRVVKEGETPGQYEGAKIHWLKGDLILREQFVGTKAIFVRSQDDLNDYLSSICSTPPSALLRVERDGSVMNFSAPCRSLG